MDSSLVADTRINRNVYVVVSYIIARGQQWKLEIGAPTPTLQASFVPFRLVSWHSIRTQRQQNVTLWQSQILPYLCIHSFIHSFIYLNQAARLIEHSKRRKTEHDRRTIIE